MWRVEAQCGDGIARATCDVAGLLKNRCVTGDVRALGDVVR